MTNSVFPIWVFVVVAALIAGVAFLIGQAVTGSGMIAAIVGSTAWTAFVVAKGRARG